MPPRKKLIEVALPLEAINLASAREKSIRFGHPSTLHLWWARRPLATCRAVIFASLVDDPDDPEAPKAFIDACKKLPAKRNTLVNDTPRMRLFDFIETLVQWESTSDTKVLETAHKLILLATDGNPPPLLDPFAGGGSIPLEAQRLGLEAYASDLNPVAVMINKAQIEIPPRFADRPPVNPRDRAKIGNEIGWKGAVGLAADVRYYGEWMREKAWERIGHLYPKHKGETVIAWLWARTVKCPNPACGAEMPLVTNFELSNKKGHQAWIEPIIDSQSKTVAFRVHSGQGKAPEPPKVGRGAKFRCLVCNQIAPEQHIKDEGVAHRMGAKLIAIVTEGSDGRNYHSPTEDQEKVAFQAQPSWYPESELVANPRHLTPPSYGMTKHSDLFTSRQLVALNTFIDLLSEVRVQIFNETLACGLTNDNIHLSDNGKGALAYAEAICVYLGMGVSRLSDICNAFCSWEISKTQVRHLFTRQAIPIMWDYAENNLFANAAGDFSVTLGTMLRVIERLGADGKIPGHAIQEDARNMGTSKPLIISTDPPYYDNVPYADLSDFFYIWLRRSLRDIYPEIFGTMLVPKANELVANSRRMGGKDVANKYFETGMASVFTQMREIARFAPYPLTVYYAFKQTEGDEGHDAGKAAGGVSSTGWETMLQGLIGSGFAINGTWPMRTEASNRMRGFDSNALASSIVLVCRPRPEDSPTISRRSFADSLRRELPVALRELQSGNIAPVDLAQASIGPGMAVYSRYKAVLEADGSPLSVRTALQLINQELDAYLAEQEGEVDADTRFAISWFEQFGFDEGAFGQADVLARAKNTSVQGVVEAFVARAGQGKVQLYTPTELYEYKADWSPAEDNRATVWEATHHLIERLNRHSESGAAMLVAKMPDELSAEARALAYRLYNICERKGWTDYARDYNALVISWPQITALAVEQKNEPTQASLFGKE